MENILIIGGVAAGATAAAKARRISSKAKISMLEAGPDISFANCGLPYFIGGDIKSRSKLILQSPESFKEQYDVEVHTHTMVLSIDREKHTVNAIETRSGEHKTFGYSKLILAQGGRPVKPDIRGAGQDHVFSLWTLEDMDKISEFINENNPKTAAVIGGGFIGLEMVEALVKRGLKVNVIETMPHVLPLMEAEISGFVENELLANGVGINTTAGVLEIMHNSVKLDNGKILEADMVIVSVGVRPTLQLAIDAGLEIGEAGGLVVNSRMQTSDPDIFAAGDMVELNHRVSGKKVRIPLAGPANRQGRIAAENALGGNHIYNGSIGTSVVRVFEALAGTTGLSLKQAQAAGIDVDAVVVHKEHHTSYYPGAETVTVMLIFDKNTGVILGGQTAGFKGADKRLDVISTATASKLTVSDIADTDFAYSPPVGTANDALNMAAYAAENKISGYSPSVAVSELDKLIEAKNPVIIDVRDIFSFEKGHISGAVHVPVEVLADQLKNLPENRPIVVYDETGKKGHQALRTLIGAGFKDVTNISGGHISMQRYARTIGFKNISVKLLPVEQKTVSSQTSKEEERAATRNDSNSVLIIDVRTPDEFRSGAYPGAVNIPLDELSYRYNELGNNASREIVVYCATGARSAYAQRMLMQIGYANVKNGGGISAMMERRNSVSASSEKSGSPLIVDVRTPGEFYSGAFPGAVNIPLDDLQSRIGELGDKSRNITLYCASGARSAYGLRVLQQLGYKNARNGGGIMQMMMHQKN